MGQGDAVGVGVVGGVGWVVGLRVGVGVGDLAGGRVGYEPRLYVITSEVLKQAVPPLAASVVIARVRVCVPPPQDLVQDPNSPQ